eukprot:g5118.t1
MQLERLVPSLQQAAADTKANNDGPPAAVVDDFLARWKAAASMPIEVKMWDTKRSLESSLQGGAPTLFKDVPVARWWKERVGSFAGVDRTRIVLANATYRRRNRSPVFRPAAWDGLEAQDEASGETLPLPFLPVSTWPFAGEDDERDQLRLSDLPLSDLPLGAAAARGFVQATAALQSDSIRHLTARFVPEDEDGARTWPSAVLGRSERVDFNGQMMRPPPTDVLWVGSRGSVSNCHYDRSDNFVTQVVGTKDWLLFPPELLTGLAVHPVLDAHYHQSSLDFWASGNGTAPEAIFGSREGASKVRHVRLNAGDTLYIPPYWAHLVAVPPLSSSDSSSSSEESSNASAPWAFSASVSVVSPSDSEYISWQVRNLPNVRKLFVEVPDNLLQPQRRATSGDKDASSNAAAAAAAAAAKPTTKLTEGAAAAAEAAVVPWQRRSAELMVFLRAIVVAYHHDRPSGESSGGEGKTETGAEIWGRFLGRVVASRYGNVMQGLLARWFDDYEDARVFNSSNTTAARTRCFGGVEPRPRTKLEADLGASVGMGVSLLEQLPEAVAEWVLGDLVEELVGKVVGVQNAAVVINYCLV